MSVPRSSLAPSGRRIALLTLGCARNEVDSEELAARLAAGGWSVTPDPSDAEVIIVNTCGFIEKAKQDSIDVLLSAVESDTSVIAAGCLAQRYGSELADSLPELAGVIGFAGYRDISARVEEMVGPRAGHRDRRPAGSPLAAGRPQHSERRGGPSATR